MAGEEFVRVIINFLPIFGMSYLLMGLISDRNRDVPGGFLFSLLMIASAIYTFGYYFEVQSSDLDSAFMFLTLEYIGLSFIGSLWVLFIMEYTGQLINIRRYVAPILILISFLTLVIVNTNPLHSLYYINLDITKIANLTIVTFDRGIWYWIFVSFSNLCLLAGSLILLKASRKNKNTIKKRFNLLLLGSFFPWLALIVNLLTHNTAKIDYGPFGLLVAAVIFVYNIYAYKLFDLIPAAKKTVFEFMRDGVLILNNSLLITESNRAAEKLLGEMNVRRGIDIATLFDKETLSKIMENEDTDQDIYVVYKQNDSDIILDIRSSRIIDNSGLFNGILLILRDVTVLKRDEDEIRKLLKEKEILLREVHHRIKNNMNTIAGFLTLQARKLQDKGAINALQEAKNKISGMMMIYDKLMHTDDFTNISSGDYLSPLIDNIVQSYDNESKITVIKKIDDEIMDSKIMFQMGIILNELLTNSFKYAFSNNNDGEIVVQFSLNKTKKIELIYRDNGNVLPETAHDNANAGLGLNLINLLVRQLKGTIDINRNGGTEFKIIIQP